MSRRCNGSRRRCRTSTRSSRSPACPRARLRPPRRRSPASPRSGRSYRALALPALDLVGAGAVPIDELLHGLEAELGRKRQLLDLRFERLGPDPLREGVELLAVVALGLVE